MSRCPSGRMGGVKRNPSFGFKTSSDIHRRSAPFKPSFETTEPIVACSNELCAVLELRTSKNAYCANSPGIRVVFEYVFQLAK